MDYEGNKLLNLERSGQYLLASKRLAIRCMDNELVKERGTGEKGTKVPSQVLADAGP